MDVMLPKPGKYVVAVSGGVDSVCLLDILARRPDLELVVAHFDHGMRAGAAKDREFVEKLAAGYEMPFFYEEGKLGAGASEAKARAARYEFLRRVQKEQKAAAIITAHHQDDVLETAIINILRGTGRKGLTALSSREEIVRPLLNVSKSELLEYARDRKLEWREDPTNADTGYLRNYVRHELLPRFGADDKQKLLGIVSGLTVTNRELDEVLRELLGGQPAGRLERQWFNQLSHAAAREVMAGWLRAHEVKNFDRQTLERLVVAAKTARAGQVFDVLAGRQMLTTANHLELMYNITT